MYHRAQSLIYYLLCLVFVAGTQTFQQNELRSSIGSLPCPPACICFSPKQVICNTGGLTEIPTQRLPSTVEELSLSKNNLLYIKTDAFQGLSLRKLILDRNNITEINRMAFRGLTNLVELSIQDTPLTHISSYSFATLQNVSTILLANNKIRYIEEYSFAGTSNVNFLILSNNPLHTVRSHAFSGLRNVGRFILPSGINIIEPDAFNGLQEVNLMKLTYMDLSGLMPFTFRGLLNVSSLCIQDSDLGVVQREAFTGMRYVDKLIILNNKIDAIEGLHLTIETAVNILRLHGNHILRAPHKGDAMFNVRELSARENHFPCDCQIHLILESDFANGSLSAFRQNNYCISPIEYNGKPMSDVDSDSIARCHDKLVKDNLGSSAMISTFQFHLFAIILSFVPVRLLLA